jgi:hypothetical protein
MLSYKLGSQDLLEYNAKYGVLICRTCQYAIQKSAIPSHLLRHKVYRDERQRLLASIAELDLLEPSDVSSPGPTSPPINSLPVISGYRCTAAGCENLCASSKRMKRHQSEVHGLNGTSTIDDVARSVKLQTFFRGTKIRYFEVTASKNPDEQVRDANTGERLLSPLTHIVSPFTTTPKSATIDLDLQTLTYFHHFTTTTSLTLPGNLQYWQVDIVVQALQCPWLMHGLLALAACHMAVCADNTDIERSHGKRLVHYFSGFLARPEESKSDIGMEVVRGEEEPNNSGKHIRDLLQCAQLGLGIFTFDQSANHTLASLMATILGLYTSTLHDRDAENAYAQGRRSPFNTAMLHRLHALPTRMAETFGRPTPDTIQDVLATLSAINSLIDCCETSLESEEAGRTFRAMAVWLTKVSDYFYEMLVKESSAALVVAAYWTTFVVRRAENCGCWFLKGMSVRAMRMIEDMLPVDDPGVQGLIKDLSN